VILDFLAEAIGQPSEPPHTHAHRQVLAFDETGVDMLAVGLAADNLPADTDTRHRTVAETVFVLEPLRDAENLPQDGKVDVTLKGIVNRPQLQVSAVCGQLHAMGETASKITDKVTGALGVLSADKPRGNQFGFGVERNPSPHVTVAKLTTFARRQVLFLAVAERPNLVELQVFARQIFDRQMVEQFTRPTEFNQQLAHGVLGRARHAAGGADGVAFYQGGDNLTTLRPAQTVHGFALSVHPYYA